MDTYERIARVIRYIEADPASQPDLATLAAEANLSPHHFHRLFSAWAGVTPKDFVQCLTVEHAKALLRRGASVLDAAMEAGLSGPGRLHDLCVTLEAATPGEWKSGGAGCELRYGYAESPFGRCLIAASARGVCHLAFEDEAGTSLVELRARWPRALLLRDHAQARALADAIFRREAAMTSPLRAHVRGTAFQVRVWRALLAVPPGSLVTYGALARAVGHPRAHRAVGSAVGRNPLAFLIPCHRVIRETGIVSGYRWGATRKRAILAWESAALHANDPRAEEQTY